MYVNIACVIFLVSLLLKLRLSKMDMMWPICVNRQINVRLDVSITSVKTNNMLCLMLDVRFKSFHIVSFFIGHEKSVSIVEKDDS